MPERFIPACAGNTQQRQIGITQAGGSSPPARGTRPPDQVDRATERFIPACAGNTPRTRHDRPATPVHPRLRGEHSSEIRLSCNCSGSSPPARGTLAAVTCFPHRSRFIPACAGNTLVARWLLVLRAVHPRLRGEHDPVAIHVFGHVRFIPACAGNTRGREMSWMTIAVHPRLRGEHLRSEASVLTTNGSSPPARGTHNAVNAANGSGRFIPACAGNTLRSAKPRRWVTVHPRLRGEHAALSQSPIYNFGSSPPARGTLIFNI